METLIEFFTFKYANIKFVVLGSILLSISSAVVGCFTFVRKKSLLGDVISHSVLPGICLAFILSGTKNIFLTIIGAFITGWLSVTVLNTIVSKTKIKEDTATGLSLSLFFGIGMLLLTYIQQGGNASQSGLDTFLFGKAAALVGYDLIIFSTLTTLVLLTVFLFYKEFVLIAFDKELAIVSGLATHQLEVLFTSLVVMSIVLGIQAVGVVLMAAMLITPAAAARFWTNRFSYMILGAVIISSISGVFGAFVSYAIPSMPTGPWIVMVLSLLATISFLFASKRGIFIRQVLRWRARKSLLQENLLKFLFKKTHENFQPELDQVFSKRQISRGLKQLKRNGYLDNLYQLTREGQEKGKSIVRRHRLWELYLTRYVNIASDHVHEDADTMEHILTPEMEKQLLHILENPSEDPHDSKIPRK